MDIVGNRTLRDLLQEREQRYGDKTYLVFVGADGEVTEYSYADFVARVRSIAAGFAVEGIGKGDKVVLHLPNCPEFLFCWFGLAWIGAVTVPSNIANTPPEMHHVLSFSDAIAVVTAPAYRALIETVADQIPAIRKRILAQGKEPGWAALAELDHQGAPPEVEIGSEDVAELLFTSGTTALPKAVMLTHANCLFAGEREWRILGIGPDDRCMTALPAFHVNAQTVTIMSALTAGATCILVADYSASKFWTQVREHRATALALVAMQLRTLLAQPPRPDDSEHSVRRIMYAINVPDDEKLAFEQRFGVELVNGYGLSEAMTIVTIAPVHGEKRWPSIGLPTLDRQVRVVDSTGRDRPVGEVGEIIVGGTPGRTLMKGYYKNEQATAEALRNGGTPAATRGAGGGAWLHTGDNGYFDEHGYLYFFDRRKDVIKVAGENVSASEVERVLLTHPAVAEAAVVAIPHAIRDEVPAAFIVAASGAHLDMPTLTAYCREHLASFKVPAVVEVRESLPKTSIGKIEKKALRKIVESWEPIR